jgi:hypothetical protein
MTCTHQWHDATTKAGPEWVCAHCKVKYSDTKKVRPTAQRQWVGLTDEEISDIAINNPPMVHEFARAIEAKLKENNT